MHLEDPLDELVGDAREAVRAEADRGGRKRDFAAMIARAHAIDPTNLSREAVAEAARFAPVVALPRPRRAPALANDDVRTAAPATTPRRRFGWLMAAAAGLLLVGAFAGAATQARRTEGSATAIAAPLVAPSPTSTSPTAGPAPGSSRHVSKDMPVKTDGEVAAPVPAEAPAAATLADDERPVEAGEPTRRREATPRRCVEPRPTETTTDEAAWVALDRAAREAWRRGDTEEARALLSALVRSDATAATIELAYGDLFVLARQADDLRALTRLWQRYLDRFPRGLYAEDARVGLCRRAPKGEASACWDLYLGTWPEGAHAGEARGPRGGEEL
ncbi:hypothetical protein [Nannocystis bainbridge]|uniref:Tetratricopeptide repeat protein n=1 Tax=Nannocystis bainbridge TaxID=2995303 RepID=A0ABT5DV54_9BACT|nr:hypothetical protein [Nannocystis bainbridge]MDC0717506.1 hypothetical protein [Nannocystis bainbridge]